MALGLSAVPIAVGGGGTPLAGAAGTFLDPMPGTLATPTVLTVDPTGADTAVVTVTNPSAINGAGVDLPQLADFQWSGIAGDCFTASALPTADFVSIAVDPSGTCTISARLISPAAPIGQSIEHTIYVLAYEVDYGNLDGYFTLRATTPIPPPPANDEVSGATDISNVTIPPYAGGAGGPITVSTVTGTTVGSTFDLSEIGRGFDLEGTGSVWFRYTATAAFEGRIGYRVPTSGVFARAWIAEPGSAAPVSFGDLRDPSGNVTAPWSIQFVRAEAGQTIWFQLLQGSSTTPGPFELELFQAPDPTEDVDLAFDAYDGTTAAVPADGSETGWFGDGDTFHTVGDDLGDGSAVTWSTLLFGEPVSFNASVVSIASDRAGSTRPLRVRVFQAPSTARVSTPAVLGAPIATADSAASPNGFFFTPGPLHRADIAPITLSPGRYYFAVSTDASQPTIFFNSYRWSAAAPGDTTPPTVAIIDPPTGSTYEVADVPAQLRYEATDDSGAAPTCVVSPPTLSRTPGQHTVGVECTDAAGNAGFASTTYTVLAPRADLSLRWWNVPAVVVGETGSLQLELQTASPDTPVSATVRVDLPAGLELAGPAPAGFDPVTGEWQVGPLAPLAAAVLTLDVRMRAAGDTTVTAEIVGADRLDPDSTPGNGVGNGEDDQASATVVRVTPLADLAVAAGLLHSLPVTVGDDITGLVEIANAGPQAATAQVRVTLDGLALRAGAPLPTGFSSGGIWTVTVPAGTNPFIELPLVSTRTGAVSMTLEVVASSVGDPDSTPGNGTGNAEDDHASVSMTVVAPVSQFALQYSGSTARTSPAPLDGATVSGSIAVFVPTAPGITRVEFFLDNPAMTGAPRQTERIAPYDFAGTGAGNAATLFSTRTLADGPHTLTARVVLANGRTEVVNASFTVSNPRPATRRLLVSTQTNRAGATPLDGATITGPVAVHVPNEPGIARVEFRVDGRLVRTERVNPYDLGGTAGNGRAQLVRFTPGVRTVTARIVFTDGSSDTITATFRAT